MFCTSAGYLQVMKLALGGGFAVTNATSFYWSPSPLIADGATPKIMFFVFRAASNPAAYLGRGRMALRAGLLSLLPAYGCPVPGISSTSTVPYHAPR